MNRFDNAPFNPRSATVANTVPAATLYRDQCRYELKLTQDLKRTLCSYFMQTQALFDDVDVSLSYTEGRLNR